MLPIYVMYDSGLDLVERSAVYSALKELDKLFPEREITLYGDAPFAEGAWSSAAWYLQRAKGVTRNGTHQLDASSLLELLEQEPWNQTPHIDVLLTSYDLTAGNLRFCFGIARGLNTVDSVYRYRTLPDADDRFSCIQAVVWHELGHVFGLAPRGRTNTEDNLGSHCTNPGCVMQQGLDVNTWARHVKEAKSMGRIYCPQCMEDLKRTMI